jgi:hypothetical protein
VEHELSTESVQGVVFNYSGDARDHGPGGIWYTWKRNSQKEFPQDVSSVFIIMPVKWKDPELHSSGVAAEWTVDRQNHRGARWALTGTKEKPTLLPSLHWVGIWHGWLTDGFLKSC